MITEFAVTATETATDAEMDTLLASLVTETETEEIGTNLANLFKMADTIGNKYQTKYTKAQLKKMSKSEVEAIVNQNMVFCYGNDKNSLIEGILEYQK